MITVDSKFNAWKLVNRLTNSICYKDDEASKRAGYDVYTDENKNIHISDLGMRLEINYADGTTENIWITEPKADTSEIVPEISEAKPKNIKEKLTDKICELIDKLAYMDKKYYYRVYYFHYFHPGKVINIECDIVDYDNQNYLICKCYDDKGKQIITKAIPHTYVCSVQREKRTEYR